MSTRKKKVEEFKYKVKTTQIPVMTLEQKQETLVREEQSKRLLRIQCYMGLEKMQLGIATQADWYLIQLRLSVGDRMVDVLEKNNVDLSTDDIRDLNTVADAGLKALYAIGERINDNLTTEFYTTFDERGDIEAALNLSDELEDLVTEFYGSAVFARLYLDTKNHLIRMHP